MSDAERIARLERTVERLCAALARPSRIGNAMNIEYELLRQYVRGDLDSRAVSVPELEKAA